MSQPGNDEKTERATPKKRRDARERGQVLKSTEVNTAFCNFVMFGFLLIMLPLAISQFMLLYREYLGTSTYLAERHTIDIPYLRGFMASALWRFAILTVPTLLCAAVSGVLINLLQVGFLFSSEPLKPKLERISMVKGFQRLFSLRSLSELLKSILKILVLGKIFYDEYVILLTEFPMYMELELFATFSGVLETAFRIALKMTLALAVIAGADYLFQWWRFEKDLMMTKQEIKDEYKLTEGDPQIKSRIRQKQREMSAMRMMDAVPSADVVITNPTHFAVALRYNEGESSAPVVVAKGQDYIARKIKETAAEHGVELVENKPLAQALYSMCEVGDEIPPEFYQAVADVLVYVYRVKGTDNRARG